jgi:hypothetical protein
MNCRAQTLQPLSFHFIRSCRNSREMILKSHTKVSLESRRHEIIKKNRLTLLQQKRRRPVAWLTVEASDGSNSLYSTTVRGPPLPLCTNTPTFSCGYACHITTKLINIILCETKSIEFWLMETLINMRHIFKGSQVTFS